MRARRDPAARLLLVEHDASLLVCTAAFLLSHGYAVDCAETAREALSMLGVRPPYEVVVTDLEFPISGCQNGLEVIRRAQEVVPRPATLLWTGLDSPWIAREAAACGADALVMKSTLTDLLGAVSKFSRPLRAPVFPPDRWPVLT